MGQAEEPAVPEIPAVQQADVPGTAFPFPDVPVAVSGVVDVRQVPNKRLAVATLTAGTVAQRVLHADLKRAAATIVAADDFTISSTSTGTFGAWPAGVPLVITAAGDLWVKAAADVELTIVQEIWAD